MRREPGQNVAGGLKWIIGSDETAGEDSGGLERRQTELKAAFCLLAFGLFGN